MNEFDIIILEKQIAIIQELKFFKTFKNLEIYLSLIDWLHQYIFYYAQLIKFLQQRKIILLQNDFIKEKSRKRCSKKIQITNSSILKYEVFKIIQKIFDKFNFLHHQDSNQWLYINFDVSKQFEFDVIIYHMQDDKNRFLDHIIKENHSKIQLILFLSKLLTDMKICYWLTELEVACLVWTVKKICHMINENLADTVVWTDHSVIIQIMKQIYFNQQLHE